MDVNLNLRQAICAANLYVSYTLNIGALTVFTPFAEELESVFEDFPASLDALGVSPEWRSDDEIAMALAERGALGWLIGAQRPLQVGGGRMMTRLHWFYGETFDLAIQLAINWAAQDRTEPATGCAA